MAKVGRIQVKPMPSPFYEISAAPIFWYGKAQELYRAANILGETVVSDFSRTREMSQGGLSSAQAPVPIISQFLLMSGFCVENLLKGITLQFEPDLISDKGTQGIMHSHDLLSLAQRAKVRLLNDERDFCIIASSAVQSWGRYPISKKAHASVALRVVNVECIQVFRVLASRLSIVLIGADITSCNAGTEA